MTINLFLFIFCLSICFSCVLSETEGSPCTSESGANGTCVDIHKCAHYVKILKDKNRPQVCSYSGQTPIVCCTDCDLVSDTRNVTVDRFGLYHFRTGNKAYDKCVDYITEYPYPCQQWGGLQRYLDDDRNCYGYTLTAVLAAIGGVDPNKGRYPYLAFLGYGENLDDAFWLCAGTLISRRYVLTAARCATNDESGPVKYIALDINNVKTKPEQWQHYNVKKVITHPDYKPTSKYNDIALVQSDKWIKISHNVLPACLNTAEGSEKTGYAVGWRRLSTPTGIMENYVLNLFSEEECISFYPPSDEFIDGYNHTTQMCYGDQERIYTDCEFINGLPLHVYSELSSCLHTIIGVTSSSPKCDTPGSSGLYTRVSQYVPWIESVVWP